MISFLRLCSKNNTNTVYFKEVRIILNVLHWFKLCTTGGIFLHFSWLLGRVSDMSHTVYTLMILRTWSTFKCVKGQLISKCLLGIFNSPKKQTKKNQLYYYGTSSRIVFVRFFGRIEDTKKTFRN